MRKMVAVVLFVCVGLLAAVAVTDVKVEPRWPWNGLVDITYSVTCDEVDDKGAAKNVYVSFSGYDKVRQQKVVVKTLSGDGARETVKAGGPYKVVWNAGKDQPSLARSPWAAPSMNWAGGVMTWRSTR